MAAIRSFHEPLVLLAGGRDKKLPWDEFAHLVSERVSHLIVFGEAAEIILKAFPRDVGDRLSISRCKDLRAAVYRAAEVVKPGDVVLLSPGGTSFDEFTDFVERGECFARLVKELP
jgi:UDP-N-acetylmuramoylalanine--D-glutamate ligase